MSPPPVDEELLLLLLELLEVLLLDDGHHSAENKPLLAVRVGAFWSKPETRNPKLGGHP